MSESAAQVLVVEDDEDLRTLLVEVLKSEDYSVATAANGLEALTWLRRHAAPALILLDLMMPVMSGLEFRASQLADRSLAEIPVIVLSASHEAKREAPQLGAVDWFSKPLDIPRLVSRVHSVC
jgi:CheY-like chemotaxis protein